MRRRPSAIAAVPIALRHLVEPRPKDLIVDLDVSGVAGVAEQGVELRVAVEMARGRELQADESDVGAVEVDGGDPRGIGDEVAQHVAAAGRDREHVAGRRDLERFEVDDRVFPDLRVDQVLERAREGALAQPVEAEDAVAVHGLLQELGGRAAGGIGKREHVFPPAVPDVPLVADVAGGK